MTIPPINSAPEILIVEDNAENLRVLETMLIKFGYVLRTADSGYAALRACATKQPDLILLDIRMPGMDGYEVCMTLKQQDATQGIPVIFISALDDMMDKVQGFASGAVDYITKPFHGEEVSARVATHIALSKKSRQLEDAHARIRSLEDEVKSLREKIRAGLGEA